MENALAHDQPDGGSELAVVKAAFSAFDKEPVSHNLAGQRLGRKGRDTRERILAATERLLAGPLDTPISLSAVAREASLGMTTLYLYFSDLTELLLAVLDPIMASAENSYVGHLRSRWPDDALAAHCLSFVESYHAFWVRHSRILHLRNSYADNGDERMRAHRISDGRPVIDLLVQQMDGDPAQALSPAFGMATILLTGLERMITVATDVDFPSLLMEDPVPHVRNLLRAQARVLELGIADRRAASRASSFLKT
jgi:AcrR family transcriptional regulator